MFVPGQRWICDAELDKGLGTVLKSDFRTVTIVFLASGETRTYSQQTAPLRRAIFNINDSLESHDGWKILITDIIEKDGLVTYEGTDAEGNKRQLPEGELNNNIQLNRPYDRLFSGQIDKNKWFELREKAFKFQEDLKASHLTGLYDARTSLIPHQLFIAHEVAKRFAPRVLLADEVGLGKTIEACLIMQHQLITGRAKRVLIVVPEPLLHQWLVELLRRFNLSFSIFDEDRCQAVEESSDFDNPFQSEQLILCNLNFLTQNSKRLNQAIDGDWDLVIIDEAHHLHWDENEPSNEYLAVESLSKNSKGLLLLTATPEQLGKASHFARLRLLDPQRFHSYESFLEEEENYQSLATAIEALLDNKSLEDSHIKAIEDWLNHSESKVVIDELTNSLQHSDQSSEAEKNKIISRLLDRHGTGRVLFRNTRNTIKGFPTRHIHSYPLELPPIYNQLYEMAQQLELDEPDLVSAPERLFRIVSRLKKELHGEQGNTVWLDIDTRTDTLIDFLQSHKNEKVLVICSSSETALDLEKTIKTRCGHRVSAFHEGLSIIERDRAASYFADQEYGAQALICSEIGSEGRNFQFAHHLFLFDLPLNPDLLEQRIGRLDRIGQKENIQIHVPYFKNSPQEVLLRWYNEGLSAFTTTCQVGDAVYSQLEPMLLELIQDSQHNKDELDTLVKSASSLTGELNEAMQKGRDRLLELNSFKPEIAEQLKSEIEAVDNNPVLQDFMETAFGIYGVDMEDFANGSYVIKPSPQMPASLFQGLTEDGMTITFDRETALTYEDMQFITWNHPFVRDVLDLITSNEQGNTALIALKSTQHQPGTILVESDYTIECIFPEATQAGLSVKQSMLRYVMTDNNILDQSQIGMLHNSELTRVDKKTAHTIVKSQSALIKRILDKSKKLAQADMEKSVEMNQKALKQKISIELERLNTLKLINPSIREEEISYYQSLLEVVNERVSASELRLDAIRIIMTH